MTAKSDHDLDPTLRAVLVEKLGDGIEVDPIAAGVHASFTGTINLNGERWFCKAVRVSGSRLEQMLNDESRISRRVGSLAPALIADFTQDSWRVLLFENAPGRHLNLSPQNSDLGLLTELVNELHRELPGVSPDGFSRLSDQWRRLSPWRRLAALPRSEVTAVTAALAEEASENEHQRLQLLQSETLAHTDLHSLNVLIHGRHLRVVDWAWTRIAPPWYDALLLTVRLREAGHSPQAALAWLESTKPGKQLDQPTLRAIMLEATGVWTWLARGDQDRPHLNNLAAAALDIRVHAT